ncbi:MAG: hypothetical protein LBT53_09280 [Puniceicoccales bacterium]|nr:hypothetical protein [Puniceicoccales bacterium]
MRPRTPQNEALDGLLDFFEKLFSGAGVGVGTGTGAGLGLPTPATPAEKKRCRLRVFRYTRASAFHNRFCCVTGLANRLTNSLTNSLAPRHAAHRRK